MSLCVGVDGGKKTILSVLRPCTCDFPLTGRFSWSRLAWLAWDPGHVFTSAFSPTFQGDDCGFCGLDSIPHAYTSPLLFAPSPQILFFFLDRDVDFGDSKLHRVISNARFRAEAGDSEITHNGSLAPLLISAPNDLWQNLFIKTRSQFPGFQVIESSRHTPREVRLGSSEQRRGCVT